ncbi:hypothetical protein AF72_00590 [Xylella taiwanensis]|uniref:Uncharacterized protein n=1 Tax=Xylella taiwanensis TaxID=1444770 RepID=Z9JM02_9GAMM|nr:hypothetical protein AB672_11440 [Xylella taiwanensis]EWS79440.1 hypothetical protein AF72_00590 [Xylella taiwanensis]
MPPRFPEFRPDIAACSNLSFDLKLMRPSSSPSALAVVSAAHGNWENWLGQGVPFDDCKVKYGVIRY